VTATPGYQFTARERLARRINPYRAAVPLTTAVRERVAYEWQDRAALVEDFQLMQRAGVPQLRWQAAHAWWKATSAVARAAREVAGRASVREAVARERRDGML
jgi:hypothetical protein